MLDSELIQRKVNLIREDLIKLEDFKKLSLDKLAKDWLKWNALEHIVMKIIGRGIDINEHLIAELGGPRTKAPRDYRETFLGLVELKVLPQEFAQEIAKSAGFRNAIVHEYNEIDKNAVYRTVGEAIKQYTEYCQYILNFLNSFSADTQES
ncbi:unnamed protein product [marine sediment metagenome]|uniref:DUF86 domain-containing protein n=1 Tax=marine sediment metagenome TaxID=412755 RepID=X1LP72_9ZZZZ